MSRRQDQQARFRALRDRFTEELVADALRTGLELGDENDPVIERDDNLVTVSFPSTPPDRPEIEPNYWIDFAGVTFHVIVSVKRGSRGHALAAPEDADDASPMEPDEGETP